MSISPDILVTVIYFTFTLLLAEGIRQILHFLLRSVPLLERSAQEFIAAFELCAICYEITILLEYSNGVLLYAAFLFLACLWWALRWEKATAAPYTYIVNWLFDDTPFVWLVVVIPSQLIGGLIFYQYYIKYLWSLGYGDIHVTRINEDAICLTDIQAPVIVAAVVEGLGVFASLLTAKVASAQIGGTISAGIDAFVSTALVVAAMNVSGGYYNSVLATATLWGCFGSTPAEHFVVYWIGETIGAIVAHIVWKRLRETVEGLRPKTD